MTKSKKAKKSAKTEPVTPDSLNLARQRVGEATDTEAFEESELESAKTTLKQQKKTVRSRMAAAKKAYNDAVRHITREVTEAKVCVKERTAGLKKARLDRKKAEKALKDLEKRFRKQQGVSAAF